MAEPLMRATPPTWMADVVRCPRCRESLETLKCVNAECGLGQFGTAPNGAPILIDFERSAIDDTMSVEDNAVGGRPGGALLRRIVRPFMGLTNGSGGKTAMKHLAKPMQSLPAPRVLLVGGGERWDGLDSVIAANPGIEIVNSDVYPSPFAHILTDAHHLAFADETFDVIILQAVMEHLIDPAAAAGEVWRVLKPNGLVLADTPFLQAVHMGAYDFTRFTPLGQRALFKRFEEIETGISAGPMSVLRWAIEHAARSLFRTKYVALAIRPLTMPLSWIDQFSPRNRYALDACSGSYFIGRKSDRTATPKEIIAAYQGAQR